MKWLRTDLYYDLAQIERAIKLRNDGSSFRAIERETGINRKTLPFILENADDYRASFKKAQKLDEVIKADYTSGLKTVAELARYYKISQSTVRKILGNLFYSCKPVKEERPKNTAIDKENLSRLISEGLTLVDISRLTGVSETSVRKWKKRFGLELPPHDPYAQVEGFEKITVEAIRRYFIEENRPFRDLPAIFGLSKKKITTFIRENGIKKPKTLSNQIRQRSCLEKYGVLSNSQVPAIVEKRKRTNLEKYGVETFFQTQSFKEKYRVSLRSKYQNDLLVNVSQVNIPQNILEIIGSKDRLVEYICANDISSAYELGQRLGLSGAEGTKLVDRFGLHEYIKFTRSVPEQELRDYIAAHYKILTNTRRIIESYELDIYVPDLKLGVEFNGNWWHSEWKKPKDYHKTKSETAVAKDIFVYHIFEYDWVNKKTKVLSQLKNLLGLNERKIYARKCAVVELPTKEKDGFLEANHLQGADKASVKLGLVYDGEVVSVMTFCKPRFNKKYEWELSRFCSKTGCTVVGGASKLFGRFCETQNPQSIITYSDKSHTTGGLYRVLGFKNIYDTEPNYVWWKGNVVLSRYQTQKQKLLKQGYTGQTEDEIMHGLKFSKIFDCGNKVWAWKRK